MRAAGTLRAGAESRDIIFRVSAVPPHVLRAGRTGIRQIEGARPAFPRGNRAAAPYVRQYGDRARSTRAYRSNGTRACMIGPSATRYISIPRLSILGMRDAARPERAGRHTRRDRRDRRGLDDRHRDAESAPRCLWNEETAPQRAASADLRLPVVPAGLRYGAESRGGGANESGSTRVIPRSRAVRALLSP